MPLFKKVYGCVGRLESEMGWHLEVQLQQLGCDTAKEDFDEKLTPRRLAMCTEYMEWVEELLEDFDLQADKRLILKGASRFYNAAGEDLSLVKEIASPSGCTSTYPLARGVVEPGHGLPLARPTSGPSAYFDRNPSGSGV